MAKRRPVNLPPPRKAKRRPMSRKVDAGWPKRVRLLGGTTEKLYSEAEWRASVKKRKKDLTLPAQCR